MTQIDQPGESETADFPALGPLLRTTRRKKNLTLSDIAKAANLSVSFLSLLERGKSAASLGSLARIAKALGEPLDALIRTPDQPALVTRGGQRPHFRLSPAGVDYERLSGSFPGQQLDAVMVHLPVGYRSEAVAEDGEEFVLVLDGSIGMQVGDEEVILAPGDTCHFDGRSNHHWWNAGAAPARVMWVGNAPIFRR